MWNGTTWRWHLVGQHRMSCCLPASWRGRVLVLGSLSAATLLHPIMRVIPTTIPTDPMPTPRASHACLQPCPPLCPPLLQVITITTDPSAVCSPTLFPVNYPGTPAVPLEARWCRWAASAAALHEQASRSQTGFSCCPSCCALLPQLLSPPAIWIALAQRQHAGRCRQVRVNCFYSAAVGFCPAQASPTLWRLASSCRQGRGCRSLVLLRALGALPLTGARLAAPNDQRLDLALHSVTLLLLPCLCLPPTTPIQCPAHCFISPAFPQIGRYLATGSEGVSLYVDVSAQGSTARHVPLGLCAARARPAQKRERPDGGACRHAGH